jgi:methionyl-tRNA formyltransferase
LKNNRYKIIYWGSDLICLPSLKWLHAKGEGQWELVAVVSQPDRKQGRGQKLKANPVAEYANEHGLKLFQPNKPGEDIVQFLKDQKVDISFVMAYGHFLGRAIRQASRLGMVNFHGSILPKYRGASPIETAIAHGETETGVSLMQISQAMDAGAVADIESVKIKKSDCALSVREKIGEATVPILERTMISLMKNELEFHPQDEALISHCRKLSKEDGMIDFELSAEEIYNRWRAFKTWPNSFCFHGENRIKVGQLAISEDSLATSIANLPCGTVILENDKLRIVTSKGLLSILELQRVGGKMLPVSDFLRGYAISDGDLFKGQKSQHLLS